MIKETALNKITSHIEQVNREKAQTKLNKTDHSKIAEKWARPSNIISRTKTEPIPVKTVVPT
jgi:hypothetical protein